MTAFAIISYIIAVILLILLILQKRELKNVSEQLKEIMGLDTNLLIHSAGSSKELDELINDINRLLKKLNSSRTFYQKKNHALEQMMTNISHDLRTPLTSALGYIDLIRSAQLSDEEKERELAIVGKRLVRLEELINSFFEFSQIISSGKAPELSEVDISALLEESVSHYYDDYCARGRDIILDCPHRRLKLTSNRNMLMRIFDNLIGNALKHGSGSLTVRAKQEGGLLTLEFSNLTSGQEIDTERVFDEFYTTDISRTKGNTGLGLAIVKQFTQMLGGDVFAKEQEGRFVITAVFRDK